MGLFDKVIGSSPENMSPEEGVAGIALAAIAADGVLAEEEAQSVVTLLARMKLFGHDPRRVQKALERSVRFMRTTNDTEQLLLVTSNAVPRHLKATTFAIAADLVMVDGDVAGEEKAFLERVQKALEVPDDLALRIVEVMSVKNAG